MRCNLCKPRLHPHVLPTRLPLPRPWQVETLGQRVLVGVAVTYMAMIVIIPFLSVFVEAFRHGLGPFVETLQEPDFQTVSSPTADSLQL